MDDLHYHEGVRAAEETLDPQDWDALRALGRRMIDEIFDYLETVRERPVWQPVPDEVKTFLSQPLPRGEQEPEAVYQDFVTNVLPYPMGNIHPRFWGWVIGTGDPMGVLAEMLAAALNPNLAGGDHVANYVEKQVIDWCKEIVGFPSEASGLLVSGGSMANLVGLTVARNVIAARAGYDLRKTGVQSVPRQMVLYASSEAHSSIQKAVELLGLGSDSLRLIPVDADFRMDLDQLRETLNRDKAEGRLPFGVVGAAGTVNTGATDDLNALADLCQAEGLWFHVDGAFGALAALSPELAPLVAGMERADSLAFDPHKWLAMPMEIGCILVRSADDHRRTFAVNPDYLAHAERGLAGGKSWYSEYGIQLSRNFRALKAWMMLKEHGADKYGRIIRQNVEQARYLACKVNEAPELECLAPVPLNIVCFRYRGSGSHSQETLNALNQELLIRLHESGSAVPSYTTLDGCYALRVANVNHRSQRLDFQILTSQVVQIGRELEKEL